MCTKRHQFRICNTNSQFSNIHLLELTHFIFLDYINFRSHVATEENVIEAIRLFNVSTMDAAKSGINQHINLTGEMANEIKACDRHPDLHSLFFHLFQLSLLFVFSINTHTYTHTWVLLPMNSKPKPR